AEHVIRLLSRSPLRAGAGAEALVERPHALDDRPPQEDRRRNGRSPHVLPHHEARLLLPKEEGRTARLIDCSSGHTVQLRMLAKRIRDACEQVRWVDAVVVGKRDEVSCQAAKGHVARAAEPRLRNLMNERERAAVACEDRLEPAIVVLVDENY